MTVKLYDQKPYDRTFTAVVQSCQKADRPGDVLFALTLDQTLFFPEEGGQSPDTGVLTPQVSTSNKPSVSVLDVQISGDEIIHFCDRPVEPGSKVTGKINWAHRFDNMQQHTGEHIVSGLVNKYYGFNNVGFHLSNETCTMDYDKELTPEQIEKLETLANQAIWDDLPVTAWYPPADELAALSYRSKIDLAEGVRLVKIKGVDLCACCAPHVSSTAQVGLLKIVDFRRYKGGMRLWIKCGSRALADYRMLHDQSAAVSAALSAPRDGLLDPVCKNKAEIEQLKTSLNETNQTILQERISRIPADQMHVCLMEPAMADDKAIREALNSLTETHSGYCAAFFNMQAAETDDTGAATWRYICASSEADCRTFNDQMKDAFPVRGGGKNDMVQGSVTADEAALTEWFMRSFAH